MGTTEKARFLKSVTVLVDTREQKNGHITGALEKLCVPFEKRKLDLGDYSFQVDGRDFSLCCAFERKANVEELYQNTMQERSRIEKELAAASSVLNQFVLVLENVRDLEDLKGYELSEATLRRQGRQVKEIGLHCYRTLQAWQSGNRYRFRTICVADPADTALRLLEEMYYYWHNFRRLTAARRERRTWKK